MLHDLFTDAMFIGLISLLRLSNARIEYHKLTLWLLVNFIFLAQALVNTSPNESLRSLVAEKVGRSWRTLASKLKVKEHIMDSIEEERRDCENCCRTALKKWSESSGSQATVRELMWCLTDMGYSIINWHIMKELNLLKVAKVEESKCV